MYFFEMTEVPFRIKTHEIFQMQSLLDIVFFIQVNAFQLRLKSILNKIIVKRREV